MNRHFASRSTVKLSKEEAERQGRITNLALKTLGAPAAIAFLNDTHDTLSAQPLATAVASEEGLQTVARLIADQKAI
ncbi:MAG: hypothetical protein ABW048_10885 [Sphingobium sp.]